jgi:hypothetical protein
MEQSFLARNFPMTELVLHLGGPDVLPNPIPAPEPDLPEPDPDPEAPLVPPISPPPEPLPA